MNIKKKLTNPFVLVAQGFAAGAIIFFATAPAEADLKQQAPIAADSAAAKEIGRA
jgi:hypothetical protein